MDTSDPDIGAAELTLKLLGWMSNCIPVKTVTERKSSHPWLTDAVLNKVAKKQAAEGTDSERQAAEECSAAVFEAYREYTQTVREELRTFSKEPKKWWRKCNQLHAKKAAVSHAPALKDEKGKWHRAPKEKADLFASTFAAKYKLNEEKANEYTELLTLDLDTEDWHLRTEKEVEKTLAALREDSATGPDGLPARLLKTCYRTGETFAQAGKESTFHWTVACRLVCPLDSATAQEGLNLETWQLQRSALNCSTGKSSGTLFAEKLCTSLDLCRVFW